jgi:Kdo2-lipid IVA lauroyltransferase/acyltransferase
VGHIPRRINLRLGAFLGTVLYMFFSYRKNIVIKNLKIAYPLISDQKLIEILRSLYKHFCMVIFDFLRFPFLNIRKLDKILTFSDEALDILANNSSGILLTAHLGNWEIIPHALGKHGHTVSAIARKQKNLGVNRYLMWGRKLSGCNIIYKKGSTRQMMSSLKHGFLLMASDQYSSRNGIPISFFGKETRSPRGASIFHLKTRAPIFFCIVYLNPDFSYTLHLEELKLELDENSTNDEKIQLLNQQYHHKLEEWIIKYPQQYLWFHRKWR